MKLRLSLLALSSSAESATEEDTPFLEVSGGTNIHQPAEGGVQTVDLTTYRNRTAAPENEQAAVWLSASPARGNAGKVTITITGDRNKTYDSRKASILLRAGDVQKSVMVIQSPQKTILLEQTDYPAAGDGGTLEISLQTNIDGYEVVTPRTTGSGKLRPSR